MTRFGSVRSFLCTVFLIFGVTHAMDFPAYESKDIHFKGGSYSDTTFEDIPYVRVDFLEELFGGASKWVPGAQQLKFRTANGREWVFSLDNPFLSVGGEMFNLTYPVRRDAEGIYLPVHPLLRLLRVKFGIEFSTPGKSAAANTPSSGANITGMALEERANGSLLKIKTLSDVKWEGLVAPPHYLLKLAGGKFDSSCFVKLEGKGLIREASVLQEKGFGQITLRLGGNYDTIEVARDTELPGILVMVRKKLREPKAEEASPENPRAGPATIIVDAGHGGKDRGAVIKGVAEAAITLAVAKELRKSLLKLGYKVKLTRDEDEYKTLRERPQFASDEGGDVFVSLHCNSLPKNSRNRNETSGYTVYILREGQSEEDKALARRENQAIQEESGKSGKDEIAPVDWILLEHQLNLYSKQSESLAESIVKNFDGFDVPKYSTGARQAGFFVLVGAYMPAVLCEMGFLTHPQDRRILGSKSGQREIARRMAAAIDRFQRRAAR